MCVIHITTILPHQVNAAVAYILMENQPLEVFYENVFPIIILCGCDYSDSVFRGLQRKVISSY